MEQPFTFNLFPINTLGIELKVQDNWLKYGGM